jgi:hypothetical protein
MSSHAGAPDPLDGLPDDLARVLRDRSIIVPQDAAVFDLLAACADAPSDTASAMTANEWQKAWCVTYRSLLKAEADNQQLREGLREIAAFQSRSPDMLTARALAQRALAAVVKE